MKPHIFRQYDIRGIVGEDLDASVTGAVGRAFVSHVRETTGSDRPKIAVGCDNRLTSPELAAGLIAGIRGAGGDVLDVGTVPTPVLYWSEVTFETDAAVQITGSHNPPEWNGIKMTVERGSLYGDAILDLYRRIVEEDFASGSGVVEEVEVLDRYVADVAGPIRARPADEGRGRLRERNRIPRRGTASRGDGDRDHPALFATRTERSRTTIPIPRSTRISST